ERQGRRAPHLRERGDLREQEGRAHRVRPPEADDFDREPGRAHKERAQAPGSEGFPEVSLVFESAEAVRRYRLQTRAEVSSVEPEVPLQAAEEPLHDQLQGSWIEGLEVGSVPLLRSQQWDHGEGDWPVARPSRSRAPAPSSDAPGAASRAELRSAT